MISYFPNKSNSLFENIQQPDIFLFKNETNEGDG